VVEHVWVEKAAYLFIIILQTLQYQ